MKVRHIGAAIWMVTSMGAYAQDRITPAEQPHTDPMLTTRKVNEPAAAGNALPWSAPAEKPAAPTPTPFGRPPATPSGKPALPANMPFGRATMPASAESSIPSAPHTTEAIPVGVVDAVEASEPAPPTPVAPGADPVTEDPTAPTELTSPIFDESDNLNYARKVVFQVLNKVTAQSKLYQVKPGETVKFGKLEITATNCRVSAPNSQPDSAGLLDIREHQPGSAVLKPLFRGWMYASSPSIAALEHPIYDVMIISCDVASPAPKTEETPKKKAPEKKKK